MVAPEEQQFAPELARIGRLSETMRRQGFTWSDVRIAPAALSRLVLAGLLDVVGSQKGRNTYTVTLLGERRLSAAESRRQAKGEG